MKKQSGFSLFIGLRNFYSFRKGKKRTMAGAAIAVALSMIPLIVVIEVSDGMIEGITRRFIELETGHIQASPLEDSSARNLEDACGDLEKLPEVNCAYPVYKGNGIIYSPEAKTGIQLKAFPEDIYERDPDFRKYLEINDGTFNIKEKNSIMLSSEIAKKLGVGVGSNVKLLTVKTTRSSRLILRPELFTVTGLFSTGYYEVDSMSGYISLYKGEKLFEDEGYLSAIFKIKDPYGKTDSIVQKIRDYEKIKLNPVSWYEIQSSMYESLYTTRTMLMFIMALIVLVAAVNITSSMIIMVIERQADIAILKSCGATNKQIRDSFIFTGFFTGLIGAIIGILAGILISININSVISCFQKLSSWINTISRNDSTSAIAASKYYLEVIPIKIDAVKIIAVGVITVLLSVAASTIPAIKAKKMTPLEIMRKH